MNSFAQFLDCISYVGKEPVLLISVFLSCVVLSLCYFLVFLFYCCTDWSVIIPVKIKIFDVYSLVVFSVGRSSPMTIISGQVTLSPGM